MRAPRGCRGRRRNGRIVHGACLDHYGDRSRPAPPGCGSSRNRWYPLWGGSPRARGRGGIGGRAGRSTPSCSSGWARPPISRPPIGRCCAAWSSGPTPGTIWDGGSSGRATRGRRWRRRSSGPLVWACSTMPHMPGTTCRLERREGGDRHDSTRDLLAMGVAAIADRSAHSPPNGRREAIARRCRWCSPPSARLNLAPSRARPSGGESSPIWLGGASRAGT